ncbi:hypothetical protein U1Q18_047827, partial [Sarracenia purpurea var. burkii]
KPKMDGHSEMALMGENFDPILMKLMEVKGFDPPGPVVLKNSSCPNRPSKTMDILLQRARIICLDEVELYFVGVDANPTVELHNPRIDLEAL